MGKPHAYLVSTFAATGIFKTKQTEKHFSYYDSQALCDILQGRRNKCLFSSSRAPQQTNEVIPPKSSLVNQWVYSDYLQRHGHLKGEPSVVTTCEVTAGWPLHPWNSCTTQSQLYWGVLSSPGNWELALHIHSWGFFSRAVSLTLNLPCPQEQDSPS